MATRQVQKTLVHRAKKDSHENCHVTNLLTNEVPKEFSFVEREEHVHDYSNRKFEVSKSTTRLLQIYIELQERNASIYNFLYESLEEVVDMIDFDDWFNDTISAKLSDLENCISERIKSSIISNLAYLDELKKKTIEI